MKKTFVSMLALTMAMSSFGALDAMAMGKKGADSSGASPAMANQREKILEVVRRHNAASVDLQGNFRATLDGYGADYYKGRHGCDGGSWSNTGNAETRGRLGTIYQGQLEQGRVGICREVSPLLPPGMSCEDMVQVKLKREWRSCECRDGLLTGYGSCEITTHVELEFTLTDKGKNLLNGALFFDPSLKSVDYNVGAIQGALENLKLLPRERKALEGFWNAVASFNANLKAEQAKSAQGEKAKPISHRDFAAQASLVVSYYRYLKDDLAELGQYGSSAGGVDRTNKDAIVVIEQGIANLIEAYGLDTDTFTKQAADYGRVFVDLMNNFSQILTQAEKTTYVRPILIQVGSKVIPASEAYGDVAARDAVMELKALWEAEAFQNFLREKLSASDDRINSLILNVSNLAYKIGLAANVDIRVLDAKDIEKIKNQKPRQ